MVIIGIIIALIIIGFVVKSYSPHNRSLESYWGLQIPSDFKEVYYTSIVGFHGDGFRYTIFETRNDVHLSFIKVFYNQQNKTIEDFIDRVIDNLAVTEDKKPPINQPYYWWVISGDKYYNNTLVIVYIPKDKMYYFFEEFQ